MTSDIIDRVMWALLPGYRAAGVAIACFAMDTKYAGIYAVMDWTFQDNAGPTGMLYYTLRL